MKTCSIIELTKKYVNEVYGGVSNTDQDNLKVGVDFGTTEDLLGGLKKDKIENVDLGKIGFELVSVNATNRSVN